MNMIIMKWITDCQSLLQQLHVRLKRNAN